MSQFELVREDPYYFTNKMMFYQREFVQELSFMKKMEKIFLNFCFNTSKDFSLCSTWYSFAKFLKVHANIESPNMTPMTYFARMFFMHSRQINNKLNLLEKQVKSGQYDVTCKSSNSVDLGPHVRHPHIMHLHQVERSFSEKIYCSVSSTDVIKVLDLGCSYGNTIRRLLDLNKHTRYEVVFVDLDAAKFDAKQFVPYVAEGRLTYEFVNLDMNQFIANYCHKITEMFDLVLMVHTAYYYKGNLDIFIRALSGVDLYIIYHDYNDFHNATYQPCPNSNIIVSEYGVTGSFHNRHVDEPLVNCSLSVPIDKSHFDSQKDYNCFHTLKYYYHGKVVNMPYRSRQPVVVKVKPVMKELPKLSVPPMSPGAPVGSNYLIFPKLNGLGAFIYFDNNFVYLKFRNNLTYVLESTHYTPLVDLCFYVEVFLSEHDPYSMTIFFLDSINRGDHSSYSVLCSTIYDYDFCSFLGFRPTVAELTPEIFPYSYDGFVFYPVDAVLDPKVYFFKYVYTIDLYYDFSKSRDSKVKIVKQLKNKFDYQVKINVPFDYGPRGIHEFSVRLDKYKNKNMLILDYVRLRSDKMVRSTDVIIADCVSQFVIFNSITNQDHCFEFSFDNYLHLSNLQSSQYFSMLKDFTCQKEIALESVLVSFKLFNIPNYHPREDRSFACAYYKVPLSAFFEFLLCRQFSYMASTRIISALSCTPITTEYMIVYDEDLVECHKPYIVFPLVSGTDLREKLDVLNA